MNIWIFNHYAITPDMPGGTRHFDLACELTKRGHQITILASSFSHKQRRESKIPSGQAWKMETVSSVQFIWLKTFSYQKNDWRRALSMVSYMLRAWWLGRKLPELDPQVKKPEVIIGSSVHLLAVLAAYWVARRYKAKFIMEVRDLWPQTLIDMGKLSEQNPITFLLRALEKLLYRRAEGIITLLPRAGEYIASLGIDEEKIAWIPNGVDLNRFERVESRHSSDNGFKVMYLGAHGQANALDVLIHAAKIVQGRGRHEIEFILIGDGPEKPRLVKRAKELGLMNMKFCDPISKIAVPKTLSEANATIAVLNDLPLYRYGISLNKLFDYLAAKKPLILAGNPVNNPVEEAGCGLTVPPRDPEALAEAIIELFRMPKEEREAMGRRGREYVEKCHSIPVLVDKLIECIEEGWVH